MPEVVDPGLCARCRWRRPVPGARSVFTLCERGLVDPAYPRYPVLPVKECRGVEPIAPPDAASEPARP